MKQHIFIHVIIIINAPLFIDESRDWRDVHNTYTT